MLTPTFDFLEAFYGREYNPHEFIESLDSLLNSGCGLVARAIPFYWRGPATTACHLFRTHNSQLRTVTAASGVSQFEITARYKYSGEEHTTKGRLFLLTYKEFPGTHLVVSLESGTFFEKVVRRAFRAQRYSALRSFLPHAKLRNLLESFAREETQSLIIKRASVHVRLQSGKSASRIMPMVSWPSMTIDEAFDWVLRENGWFQSVECEALSRFGNTRFCLRRDGEVVTNGKMETIFNHFVKPASKLLYENVAFFGKRSRADRTDGVARALVIEFDHEQFADIEENKRFISSIRRYPRASSSVLHANPYIHVALLDYYDASSFDIWVLSTRRVVIVPQFKGSVQAIERIVRHIFDTYAEGTIHDYRG